MLEYRYVSILKTGCVESRIYHKHVSQFVATYDMAFSQ